MGPTGSGKSGLGVEVAKRLGGEIVSADAFAVYRGMNIGTDKPSETVQQGIPHHLLDILDPDQPFSAGEYVTVADAAIAEIVSRNRQPIIVGGSHFYIHSLLFGLFPSPAHDSGIRARLEQNWDEDNLAVFNRLNALDPEAATRFGPSDRQRILRALEVFEVSGEPISCHWRRHERAPRYRFLLTAPHRTRSELYVKIDTRVDEMFAGGLVGEVEKILDAGIPRNAHSLKAIGYRQVLDLVSGRMDRDGAIEQTKRASRKLAKRQLTWLRGRREGRLQWVPPLEEGGAENVCEEWSKFLGSTSENRIQNTLEFEDPTTDRQPQGSLI